MLCANNYPAKLQLNFGIDNIFLLNDLVRRKTARNRSNGLQLVEISDDFWEIGQLTNPEDVLRNDNIFDYKFAAISHNTIRGAAGGAILCAELMKAKELF